MDVFQMSSWSGIRKVIVKLNDSGKEQSCEHETAWCVEWVEDPTDRKQFKSLQAFVDHIVAT